MNISADGILGTAQKINQKRLSAKTEQKSPAENRQNDTVQISTRLSGRLNNLQQDLTSTQDSLSKNQVIRNGLERLLEDVRTNGNNRDRIIAEVQYNNQPVLADFLNNQQITEEYLTTRMNDNRQMINEDINRLSRLQVETENIFASNLVPNSADLSQNIAGSRQSAESISQLNADVVMRLTK